MTNNLQTIDTSHRGCGEDGCSCWKLGKAKIPAFKKAFKNYLNLSAVSGKTLGQIIKCLEHNKVVSDRQLEFNLAWFVSDNFLL